MTRAIHGARPSGQLRCSRAAPARAVAAPTKGEDHWIAHALAAAALLVGVVARADPPAVRYTLVLADDSRSMTVDACVAAPAKGRRFSADSNRAAGFLLETSRSSGAAVERDDGDLLARGWQAGECLRYRVDLAALTAAGRHRRQPPGLLAPPEDWLWLPDGVGRGATGELTMELPSGLSAIAPWASSDTMPPRRHFSFPLRSATWSSLVAFGRFPERDVVTDGGRARLALLGGMTDAQRDVLTDYFEKLSRDVTATFPRIFALGPQLVVVPSRGRHDDAVPWGESMRGGGRVALYLVVDLDRALEEYFGSWTVHHEMVHLAHPYLDDEGRWIAEGFATYYQNVLRARGRRITARQAWKNLESGFERGRRDRVMTDLTTTSAQIGRAPHYMRVYWAGTALALRADVALRTRGDPSSLEAAINGFIACCLAAQPVVTPRNYLAALDRAVGGGPLVTLFDAHASQPDVPDLGETYAALGITLEGGELHFDADPNHVALRTAIMGSD